MLIDTLHLSYQLNIYIYVQVIEGVLPEGSQEGEVQKFSINIQEDGSLNAVDLETLRNLYSDQQIVIVLENQQQ